MTRQFYSTRLGSNLNAAGFSLDTIKKLFFQLYSDMKQEGYLDEYLGSYCVDAGEMLGKIRNPGMDMLLKLRTDNLWPLEQQCHSYNEDNLFDVVEYLYTCVSKPLGGVYHGFSGCGMHWDTFSQSEGQLVYVRRVNEVISLYCEPFELSDSGEVLRAADAGFQPMFEAEAPTLDNKVGSRIASAVLRYRRHGSSIEERRLAVRDLADVLEYLRPQMKDILDSKDKSDLFNIANNFGIRHHNPKQKVGYDAALWLSWMFYFYLATIHVVLRKIERQA